MDMALSPYSLAMLGKAMLKLLPEKGVRKLLNAMVSCTALLSTAKPNASEPVPRVLQGLNKSFQVESGEGERILTSRPLEPPWPMGFETSTR